MKKRTSPTIVERAILSVDGYDRVFKSLQQQVILRGQSKSALYNYIRRIALICLHFNQLPEHISDDKPDSEIQTPIPP